MKFCIWHELLFVVGYQEFVRLSGVCVFYSVILSLSDGEYHTALSPLSSEYMK